MIKDVNMLTQLKWYDYATLHKKWSFPLRISSINVTKSVGNCEFIGHSYWRNPYWKTSYFAQCFLMIDSLSSFTLTFLYDFEIMFSLYSHHICNSTQTESGYLKLLIFGTHEGFKSNRWCKIDFSIASLVWRMFSNIYYKLH